VITVSLGGAAPAVAQTDPPAQAPIVKASDAPIGKANEAPIVDADDGPHAASSIPSFGNLFGEVIRDFKRFPSRSNLTWLGVGALGAAAGREADTSVTRAFIASPDRRDTFAPGAFIGSTPFQLGAAFTT